MAIHCIMINMVFLMEAGSSSCSMIKRLNLKWCEAEFYIYPELLFIVRKISKLNIYPRYHYIWTHVYIDMSDMFILSCLSTCIYTVYVFNFENVVISHV